MKVICYLECFNTAICPCRVLFGCSGNVPKLRKMFLNYLGLEIKEFPSNNPILNTLVSE